MAEVAGLTFRFQHTVPDILDALTKRLSPQDRDRIVRRLEPVLVQRDRQVEDAITRALACTCGAH